MHKRLGVATAAALVITLAAQPSVGAPTGDSTRGSLPDLVTKPIQNRAVSGSAMLPNARATVRTANWVDPGGDGPIPARDLRRLSVTHNRTKGSVVAKFTFGARPTKTKTAVVGMILGVTRSNGCHSRAAIVSTTHKGPGQWALLKADGTAGKDGKASYTRSKKTVTLRARAGALRRKWTCAFARLLDGADGEPVYDETGWVPLRAPARAKLTLSTPDTRTQTSGAVGRWKRVKVRVTNDGDAKAKGVRVRLSSPKGVMVKPRTLSFKSIKVDSDRTKRVRVKLTKRSTKTVQLTATAKNAAKRRGKVVIHPKPKPLSKKLAGRYFWGVKSHADYAWDNRAVAFVNKRFAYVGFPKRGVRNCKKVTKHCKRYTFRKKSGKLRVGGKSGTYRKGRLVVAGIRYSPTKLPKPGTRWNLTLLHRGFNGCQLFAPCATWAEWLTLRKNGTFTWKHTSIITARKSETGMPPGRGRYRIKRNGHLVLNYRGGKTRHTTIAIDTDAKRRPDPYGAGLLINDLNFYP